MDQHLQRRRSLHEDGTPQILLIPPSDKNLGHHLTLSIDTFNYEKKSSFVKCQIWKHLSYRNLGHHLTLSIDTSIFLARSS